MATISKFKQSEAERRRRTFSEDFKIQKVRELERKQSRISDICKEYEVSETAVRRWIYKYSSRIKKGIKTIVESESDTKKLQELRRQVAELQRMLGEKEVQLQFKDKMIEIAEEMYGIDIKKKLGTKPLDGSGETESSSK
jgi:transposase